MEAIKEIAAQVLKKTKKKIFLEEIKLSDSKEKRYRQFFVELDGERVAVLKIGVGLQSQFRRHSRMYKVYPKLLPMPIACLKKMGLDYYFQEYLNGPILEDELVKGNLNSDQGIKIFNTLYEELNKKIQLSSFEMVKREVLLKWSLFYKKYFEDKVDRVFVEEKIIPILLEDFKQNESQFAWRWTNGDLIGRNILLSEDGPKIIDLEFIERTHFYKEDEIRFFKFSQRIEKLFEKDKKWEVIYFFSRQFHLVNVVGTSNVKMININLNYILENLLVENWVNGELFKSINELVFKSQKFQNIDESIWKYKFSNGEQEILREKVLTQNNYFKSMVEVPNEMKEGEYLVWSPVQKNFCDLNYLKIWKLKSKKWELIELSILKHNGEIIEKGNLRFMGCMAEIIFDYEEDVKSYCVSATIMGLSVLAVNHLNNEKLIRCMKDFENEKMNIFKHNNIEIKLLNEQFELKKYEIESQFFVEKKILEEEMTHLKYKFEQLKSTLIQKENLIEEHLNSIGLLNRERLALSNDKEVLLREKSVLVEKLNEEQKEKNIISQYRNQLISVLSSKGLVSEEIVHDQLMMKHILEELNLKLNKMIEDYHFSKKELERIKNMIYYKFGRFVKNKLLKI